MMRIIAIIVLMQLTVGGCTFKGGPTTREETAQAASETAWRPLPVAMRIYPSSRFAREGEGVVLEARVELSDAMNDPVKSAGAFRFELYPASRAAGGQTTTQRLYAWDVALASLTDQRRYYDSITRTYFFRLKLDDTAAASRGVTLIATFMPAAGDSLEAQASLAGF